MSRFTSKCIDRPILQLQESIKRSTTAVRCVSVYRWCGPLCGGGCGRDRCGFCICVESWCESCDGLMKSRHCFCYSLCFLEGVAASNWGQKVSSREDVSVKMINFHSNTNSLFSEVVIFYGCADLSWGRWRQSPHSSFHSTHTWSHTDTSSAGWRSHSDPHRTLWKCSLFVSTRIDIVQTWSFRNQWWTKIFYSSKCKLVAI